MSGRHGSLAAVAGLYAAALTGVWLLAAETSPYWDSPGYVLQALTGQIGGLGFGRPVFIALSHVIARAWLEAGGSPWHVEPVLRVVWTLVSCAAAPLVWALARRAGASPRAAIYAGLAVACSPAMAHAAGAVLTDGPAATACLAAFWFGIRAVTAASGDGSARRWAMAAGATLGLAMGLREQSAANALVVLLLLWVASVHARLRLAVEMSVACALVVILPVAWAGLTQPGYLDTIEQWFTGLAHDRALGTFGWRTVLTLGGWVIALGPAMAVAGWVGLARITDVRRPETVLCALVVPSVVHLVWLGSLHSASYSPRFFLVPFACALALPGAITLDRWAVTRGRVAVVCLMLVVPLLVAGPVVRRRGAALDDALRSLPAMLGRVPPDSVIVSGRPCASVPLVRRLMLEAHGADARDIDWQPVCPGWAWPGDLARRLDAAHGEGRTIVLDLRSAAWVGAEQRAALADVLEYHRHRATRERAGSLIVWRDTP